MEMCCAEYTMISPLHEKKKINMQLHATSNKRKESNMMQKSAGEDHRASQHFCHVLAYMWWMYKTVFPNIGVRKDIPACQMSSERFVYVCCAILPRTNCTNTHLPSDRITPKTLAVTKEIKKLLCQAHFTTSTLNRKMLNAYRKS